MSKFRVALIGIGGFGRTHAGIILKLIEQGALECPAFCEINIEENCEYYDRFIAHGAAHYTDYEQMLASGLAFDFAVIATPIALHKPMCVRTLEAGYHVMVEKPPAVTVQDIDAMIEATRTSGKLCQVNFQNTSGRAFRLLLERIAEGALGQVTHVTGVGLWKRNLQYYARTPWAGKLTHRDQYVLDGTINNPLAHLLNNCLLVAGAGDASAAAPETVHAELYHANAIESEDTSCIRFRTKNGVTVNYYATLCHHSHETPYIKVRGTKGEAHWTYNNDVVFRVGGEEEAHRFDRESLLENMYFNLMEAIRYSRQGGNEGGQAASGKGASLYSPLEGCRSFVAVSNGAFESAGTVQTVPSDYIVHVADADSLSCQIEGVGARIVEAAEKGLLLSELSLPWAAPTQPFRMDGYTQFQLPAGMAK